MDDGRRRIGSERFELVSLHAQEILLTRGIHRRAAHQVVHVGEVGAGGQDRVEERVGALGSFLREGQFRDVEVGAAHPQRLSVGTEVNLESRPEHALGAVAGSMHAEFLDVPAAEAHGVRPRPVGLCLVWFVDEPQDDLAGEAAGFDAPEFIHLA